ncbi:MAG: hypothetical protein FJW18_02280 [Actinobacteria bacterium]|nr:hypothetical protein [Actinomycetota bacterium]
MTWLAGIDTRSVGDTGSSVVVLVVAMALVAAGVALTGITVWFWRSTRPDPEALAPLVVMSSKRWRLGNPIERRQALDVARPGASVAVLEPVADDLLVDDASADDPVIETAVADEVVANSEIPVEIAFALDEPVAQTVDGLFDDLDEDSDQYDDDPVNSGPIERGGSSPIDPLLGR